MLINSRVVHFKVIVNLFVAPENSVRNEEKKILTKPPKHKKNI